MRVKAKSWWSNSTDVSEVKISDTMAGKGLLPAGNRKGRPAIKQTNCDALRGKVVAQQQNNYAMFLSELNVMKPKTSQGHFTFYPTHEDFRYYSKFQPFNEVVIFVASLNII